MHYGRVNSPECFLNVVISFITSVAYTLMILYFLDYIIYTKILEGKYRQKYFICK